MRKIIVLSMITLDGVLQAPVCRRDHASRFQLAGGKNFAKWRDCSDIQACRRSRNKIILSK